MAPIAQGPDQHHLLIAVLSDDNASEDSGIATIEAVAEKAADAIVATKS